MDEKERTVKDEDFVMPIAEIIMFDKDDIISTSGSGGIMSSDINSEDYLGE